MKITATVEVYPGMKYLIISAHDRKTLAHGVAASEDSFTSLLAEAKSYIRANCFAPVILMMGETDVADNREEF